MFIAVYYVTMLMSGNRIDETLLLTKLFIPPPAQTIIACPRLVSRLMEGIRRPLTLITAPAGWGKTTLLATWRADPGGGVYPVAWVSLNTGPMLRKVS